MLALHFKNRKNTSWHVGNKPLNMPIMDVYDIESIYADGDEARHILAKFGRTIPWNGLSHNEQQVWYGDIAKSIASSL